MSSRRSFSLYLLRIPGLLCATVLFSLGAFGQATPTKAHAEIADAKGNKLARPI